MLYQETVLKMGESWADIDKEAVATGLLCWIMQHKQVGHHARTQIEQELLDNIVETEPNADTISIDLDLEDISIDILTTENKIIITEFY